MNVAYMGQGGQFRTESEKDLGYDPSYKSNRYNFRTNLDYKVASNFKLSLNIASYLEKVNTPQTAKLFNNSVDELVYEYASLYLGNTSNRSRSINGCRTNIGRWDECFFLPVKL